MKKIKVTKVKKLALGGNADNQEGEAAVQGGKLAGSVVSSIPVVGQIFGPIFSGIEAIFNAQGKKMEAVTKRQLQDVSERKTAENNNKSYGQQVLANYPVNGVGDVDYYAAYGGKINILGNNKEIPIDSKASMVLGDEHGEDTDNDGFEGITLAKGNQPFAEVEHKEVVDKNGKVFSERVKTPNGNSVANERTQIANRRNVIEDEINSLRMTASKTNNEYDKNAINREIDYLNGQLMQLEQDEKALFDYQQSINGSNNTPKMGYGGNIKKYVGGGDYLNNLARTDFNQTYGYDEPMITEGTSTGDGSWYLDMLSSKDHSYDNETPLITEPQNSKTSNSDYFLYDDSEIGLGESPYINLDKNKEKKDLNWDNYLKNAGNYISKAVPYMDNVYNSIALANLPTPPSPLRKNFIPFDARINTNPQINQIDRGIKEINKDIDNNTSNSSVARTQKMINYSKGVQVKNDVLAKAALDELSLRNRNIELINKVNSENLDRIDNYNTDIFNSDMYRINQNSSNLANITSDSIQSIRDAKQENLDREQLGLISRQYESSGVYVNQMGTPSFDNMVQSDPEFKIMLWNKVRGNKELKDKFVQLYGQPK